MNSPRLFTMVLKYVFEKLNWCNKDISNNEFKLNPRFAGDLGVIPDNNTRTKPSLNKYRVAH